MTARVHLNQVYFETRRYGKYLRVSCIDPDSGEETYTAGPARLGEQALRHSAKRKLEYILTKKLKEAQKGL